MSEEEIVKKTELMVKEKLMNEGSGHDWWHVWRVWQLAKRIAEGENANLFIVEIAALLHDIADWKSNDGDLQAGGRVTKEWLDSLGVNEEVVLKIVEIVDNVSFKGANVDDTMSLLEGKIVQDADRLDAMGAMGIGRVFTYGGYKGRAMYNPEVSFQLAENFEQYKLGGQTSINHFYEKILLLKDRIHTKTGLELAEGRHQFIEVFLNEFFAEWNGEK